MAAEPPVLTDLEVLELAGAPALGHELAARISRALRVPCRLAKAPEALVVPELRGRDQADADRLLQLVEALEAPPGRVRIALTGRDIGHPIFTHFFGRARHGGRAVLISTARLDPAFYGLPEDSRLTLRRATLEVFHELGHSGGLGHCVDWDCVMHFAATVEDLDNRGHDYCPQCAATLRETLGTSSSP